MRRLRFNEHGIEYRELVEQTELNEAFRFRYEMCVLRLRWVDGNPDLRIETDKWDATAWHFGAYIDGVLVGYVRMAPDRADTSIMSRECFGYLLKRPAPELDKQKVGDISRLILLPGLARDKKRFARILFGLYRLAYARARLEGIRYWYFVTSRREIQGLRYKGLFPVRVLGDGITPDKKHTYVAFLDLAHARWMLSILLPWRVRRYENCAKQLEQVAAVPDAPLSAPASQTSPTQKTAA